MKVGNNFIVGRGEINSGHPFINFIILRSASLGQQGLVLAPWRPGELPGGLGDRHPPLDGRGHLQGDWGTGTRPLAVWGASRGSGAAGGAPWRPGKPLGRHGRSSQGCLFLWEIKKYVSYIINTLREMVK